MSDARDGSPTTSSAWVVAVGGALALFGAYWDEAWHTDLGRDAFASPPHLVLYAGVGVMLAVAAAWAWRWSRAGLGLRGIARAPERWLPLVGAAIAIAGAPVDDAWHRAFGRDAVMWSPPHVLGVAGLFALGGGVLLAVRGRAGRLLTAATASLVLGPAVVLVMEYEADVPQFALTWYLPVLGGGLALAFGLVRRAVPTRWAASDGAFAYTVGRGLTSAALALLGHSTVVVPPVVAPALLDDVLVRRGASATRRAAVLALTLHTVYPAWHAVVPGGSRMGPIDVVLGFPVTVAAAWAGFAALAGPRRRVPAPPAPVVAGAVAVVVLAAAPVAAWAHDPGQGERVAGVHLAADVQGRRITVTGEVAGGCDGLRPIRTTARRAGLRPHGPLRAAGACAYRGTVAVPADGRWFVYLELAHAGGELEAWLPVQVPGAGASRDGADLYRATPSSSSWAPVAAGVVLYGLSGSAIVTVVRSYRRAPAVHPRVISSRRARSRRSRRAAPRGARPLQHRRRRPRRPPRRSRRRPAGGDRTGPHRGDRRGTAGGARPRS